MNAPQSPVLALHVASLLQEARAAEGYSASPCVRRRRREAAAREGRFELLLEEHTGYGILVLSVRIAAPGATIEIGDERIDHWLRLGGGDWIGRDAGGRLAAWLALPPTARTLDAEGRIAHETLCPLDPEAGYPCRALRFEQTSGDPYVDVVLVVPQTDCRVDWAPLEAGWHAAHPALRVAPLIDAGLFDSFWRCWTHGNVYAPWGRDGGTEPRAPNARTALLHAQFADLLVRITGWAGARWLRDAAGHCLLYAEPPPAPAERASAIETLLLLHRATGEDHWRATARSWAEHLIPDPLAQVTLPDLAELAAALEGIASHDSGTATLEARRRAAERLEADLAAGRADGGLARLAAWHARAGAGPEPESLRQQLARWALPLLERTAARARLPLVWPDGYLQWRSARRRPGEDAIQEHLAATTALVWLAARGARPAQCLEGALAWACSPDPVRHAAAHSRALLADLVHGMTALQDDAAPSRVECLSMYLAHAGAYSDVPLHPSDRLVTAGEAAAAGLAIDAEAVRLFRLGKADRGAACAYCANISADPQAVEDTGEAIAAVRMPGGAGVDTSGVIALPPYSGIVLDLAPGAAAALSRARGKDATPAAGSPGCDD